MGADYHDTCCYSRLWSNRKERNNARVRGIFFACILAILGLLQIISTLKAALTDPGTVPKASAFS